MNEATTVTIAILAILIPVLSALIYALYTNIKESQKATNDALEKSKDDAEKTQNSLWQQMKEYGSTINAVSGDHRVWCQKHEDTMHDHERRLKSIESAMYDYKHATAEIDARMQILDKKPTAIKRLKT